MKKERIIIKLSGASFAKDSKNCIIESGFIQNIAKQLITLSKKYQIGVVVGGGNIWRGNIGKKLAMNPNVADGIGMLATIMNSMALVDVIKNNGGIAKVFSSVTIDGLCDIFDFNKVDLFLNDKNSIAIFAGGTGSPFFTTDTAASLRACQINAKKIYMGKNGVDGVYDSDPKINKNAKRFAKLTYQEVIDKNLSVMDLTAITMCKEHDIQLFVFNFDEKDSLLKVVNDQIKYTLIK